MDFFFLCFAVFMREFWRNSFNSCLWKGKRFMPSHLPQLSFLGSLSLWLCTHDMLTSLLFILLSHIWLGCKPLWESEESSGWQYWPSHKMPWTLVMKAHLCPNAGCLIGFLVLVDTVDRVYSNPLIQKWVLIHNYIFLSVFSQISVGF